MSVTVAELGQTECELLSQIVSAYGLSPFSQQTEVEYLRNIAVNYYGVSVASAGQTEVPLLSQILSAIGVAPYNYQTEVPLLSAIVLNLPGSTYTQATLGQTEVELLKQWALTAGGGGTTITGEYLTPDGSQYYVTPSGTQYYQQP